MDRERFKAAYRHFIDLFRSEKVTNVTWVLGLSFNTLPEESWNRMKNYFPGDDYVDWIGLSLYGPLNSGDDNQFLATEIWDIIHKEVEEIPTKKPIIILELGVGEYE